MKTQLKMVAVLLLSIAFTTYAQDPDEAREKKMMDSIMGMIPEDQRGFVEQMMKMGEEADEERKAEKEQVKNEQQEKNKIARKKNEDEFYWRNKIATNTQGKFENWSQGAAEVKVGYGTYDRQKRRWSSYMKLGKISADGQLTMQLPNIELKKWPGVNIIENSGDKLGHYFNDRSLDLKYSDKNVTYLSTNHRLSVYQGEENIGFLNIGNSIKPVVNLNAPCCFNKAGDGYSAYWVFMSQANTIKGSKDFRIDGTTDSGKKVSDSGKIVHDLDFKAGWNLVLQSVEGNIHRPDSGISDPVFWQNQYFTATTTMPADAKYYFHSNQDR